MPIEWSNELTTGVEKIDSQHKELINRINKLHAASREGKGKEVIDELMVFLEDYVKSHFGEEERFMKQYSYPQTDFHIAQHRDFIKRYQELKTELHSTGQRLITVIETNELLGRWWINHITKLDRSLGMYLRERLK